MSNLIIYKASAGSGKTFRLAAEYIKLLLRDPENYRKILAVTFTNKATAEMKNRIIRELQSIALGERSNMFAKIAEELKADAADLVPNARRALSLILHDYTRFSVSTIDSFVQRIIQSLLWEIGEQGGVSIELDYKPVLEKAADILVDSASAKPELLDWFTDMVTKRLEEGKSWDIRAKVVEVGQLLFSETFRLMEPAEVERFTDKQRVEVLRNKLLEQQRDLVLALHRSAQLCKSALVSNGLTEKDFSYGNSGVIGVIDKTLALQVGSALPVFGARVTKALQSPSGDDGWVSGDVKKNLGKFTQIKELVATVLHPEFSRIEEQVSSNSLSYNASTLVLRNLEMLALLGDLWLTVRKLSRDEGFLLLADSGPLLRMFVSDTDAPFVYEKVGNRYEHFMIDEFQDTSVVQWHNFKPLIDNSLAQDGFSMVVGDVKQAIYRWRNGDWRILATGLQHDFSLQGIDSRELNQNFRSLPQIVTFNNQFFEQALEVVLGKLTVVGNTSAVIKELEQLVRSAYKGHQQQAVNSGNGYVQVSFIEPLDDTPYDDCLNLQFPKLVDDLINRGYKPGDISVLVRRNKEGQRVADMLLSYQQNVEGARTYDVVSNEGLLLRASVSVRMVVAAFRLIYNPKDGVSKAMFAGFRPINHLFNDPHSRFTDPDIDTEISWLSGLRTRPLQEVFEAVVARYGLANRKAELAYLSELHEQIVAFSKSGIADLGRFLEWWSQVGNDRSLSMPDSSNAVTIQTIHKAKGLQYPVVIMPYADWKMSPRSSTIWVSSSEQPFDTIPKYPIEATKLCESSLFAGYYMEEKVQELVDNLNSLYVAFTRPERELYVFSVAPKDSQEKADSLFFDTTSKILGNTLSAMAVNGVMSRTDDDTDTHRTMQFTLGIAEPVAVSAKGVAEQNRWNLSSYTSGERHGTIRLKMEATDFFADRPAERLASLERGKLLHHVFSQIKSQADISDVLTRLSLSGTISVTEVELVKSSLNSLIAREPYSTWFSGEWKALNEVPILLPGGKMYRPDRVIVSGDAAIVIDFKFGEQSEVYNRQVKRYVSLIADMGYRKVEGYLWYVDSDRIEEVKS